MVRHQVLNILRFRGAWLLLKKLKSDKLDAKLIKGRFVGYPNDSLGYCFYLPAEQVVIVSKDAIFLEKEFLKERKVTKEGR